MGKEQMIISIGREFGSGGHVIAEGIAERFGLSLYDYNLLREIASDKKLDAKTLEKYDELPKNIFFSRTVRGYSNSPEENIASLQFEFLRKKAGEGKSFVIVGRCAETVLKERKELISIFVLGDMEKKIERIAAINNISEIEAENLIYRYDKKRKAYHNYYCERRWGDSRNYDLSINSSKLGIEETINILEEYIKKRQSNISK